MVRRNFIKALAGLVPAVVAGTVLAKSEPKQLEFIGVPHQDPEGLKGEKGVQGDIGYDENGWRRSVTLRPSKSIEIVQVGGNTYKILLHDLPIQ